MSSSQHHPSMTEIFVYEDLAPLCTMPALVISEQHNCVCTKAYISGIGMLLAGE